MDNQNEIQDWVCQECGCDIPIGPNALPNVCKRCRNIINTSCDVCGKPIQALFDKSIDEYRCDDCQNKELVYIDGIR